MRKLTLLLIVVAALAIPALPAAAQDYTNYIVQPGDSLAKIALRYCTSWTEIYNANAEAIGSDPNVLEVGTLLIVPNRCGATHLPSRPGEQPVPPESGSTVYDRGVRTHATGTVVSNNIYSVAWGDTLFSIGQRFGVTVDQLRAANGLNEDSILFATSRIVIPGLNGVYVQQPILRPGEGPPVPGMERAFAIGECRIEVLSDYPVNATPNGAILTTVPPGTYAAARVSVIDNRNWYQIEYIDTLIWIGDTIEEQGFGKIGNCAP